MSIREWFARLKGPSQSQSSQQQSQFFEPLEPRLLLSVTMPGLHGPYEIGADLISPVWFEKLESYSGDPGSGPNVTQIDWNGQPVDVRPNEWIVQLTSAATAGLGTVADAINLFCWPPGAFRVMGGLGMAGQLAIRAEGSVGQISSWLAGNPSVAYFQPNRVVVHPQAIPNDPLLGDLWGLHNIGQTGGTIDADIDAPEAWDILTGSSQVVVGVIDTGVDYTHPDLAANMWRNELELYGEPGRDDDGNNLVDDIYGWDFAYNDNDPMDGDGHGTHVAGTIAAVGNNALGVAGVCWSAKIMAIKALDDFGYGDWDDLAGAINYATWMRNHGVNIRVTNNSWGGYWVPDPDPVLIAVYANQEAGMLFVASAGNEANNNDVFPAIPASYNLDNIISVAASDHDDEMTWWSNYGRTSVDLAAPGENILSTTGGGYDSWDGTSMACPHVVGVAALAWAAYPTATYQQVRDAIFAGVDHRPSLLGRCATGGRLNAYGTLRSLLNNDLRGTVWADANRDGVHDAGELGVGGLTVYLDSNSTGQREPGERSVVTAADGTYVFNVLPAGVHRVRVAAPQAWLVTAPASGFYDVTVGAGASIQNLDFGGYDARPTADSQSLAVYVGDPIPVQITLTGSDDQTPVGELTFQVVTAPQYGQVALVGGNVAWYTPDGGAQDVTDFFEFVTIDRGNPDPDYGGTGGNVGTSDPALVTILLYPVNDAPVALAVSATLDEDPQPVPYVDIPLLGSDEETAAGDLVFAISTGPRNGTLQLIGSVGRYTPRQDFNGTDSFQFTVTDTGDPAGTHANPGDLTSLPATVTITVNPINDAPMALDQALTTPEDTPLAILMAGSDVETPGDELLFTITQQPAHGTLTVNANQATYTPAANFSGTDSFRFTATDTGDPPGAGGPTITTAPATATITVSPVNDRPTADAQTVLTSQDQAVLVTLTGSDVETPPAQLAYAVSAQPTRGTLTQLGPTEYRYDPNPGYSGLDSLQFTVTDTGQPAGSHANPGDLVSDPAVVTVAVARAEQFQSGSRLTVPTPAGSAATISLSGPGAGVLYNISHLGLQQTGLPGVAQILLTGTTATSSLQIISRDVLPIGSIIVQGGSLMNLYGRTVNLLGDIDVQGGTVRNIWLNDVAGQGQMIRIGAPVTAWSTTTMRFNRVQDLSIHSATRIRSLTAAQWDDTDGTPDQIIAPVLDRLTITGSWINGLAGHFAADVNVTGNWGFPGAAFAMAFVNVRGDLRDGDWDVAGNIGTFMVGGVVDNWSLEVHSNLNFLRLGRVLDADVAVDGRIGMVYATEWLQGSLQANTLRSLMIPGRRFQGINGNFGADVTLAGEPGARQAFSFGTVAGDLTDCVWNIVGNAGGLSVRGTVDNWELNLDSSLTWLRAGSVITAHVNVSDNIGTLSAAQWLAGSIQADKIQSLMIPGQRYQGINGDFGPSLTLRGDPAGRRTLGFARVAGTLSNTATVAGNAGFVSLGGLRGDLLIQGNALFVRVQDPLTAAAPAAGEMGKVEVTGTARISSTAGSVRLTNDVLYTRPGNTYRIEELRWYDALGAWWDYALTSQGTNGRAAGTGVAQVSPVFGGAAVAFPTGDGTVTESWQTTAGGRALSRCKVGWGTGNYMDLTFDPAMLAMPETVEIGRTYSGSGRLTGAWLMPPLGMPQAGTCSGTATIQTVVRDHEQQSTQAGVYLAVKGTTTLTARGYVEYRDENGNFRHGPFTLTVAQTWWASPDVGIVKGDTRVSVQMNATGGTHCWYNVTGQRSLLDRGTSGTIGVIPGVNFNGHDFGGWAPPDPIAAAGPANLIAVVNSRIGIWSKTGTVVDTADLEDFFAGVYHGYHGPFDPWIIYDSYSGRYVVTAEEVDEAGQHAYMLIAVSAASNPNDLDTAVGDTDNDWHVYAISATHNFGGGLAWIDYPKIAADADSLYITGNYFGFEALAEMGSWQDARLSDHGTLQAFEGVRVTRLTKAPMLEGTLGNRTDVLAPGAGTLQPAQSFGRAAHLPQLFVDCYSRYGQGITVWEMNDDDELTAVTTIAAPFTEHAGGAPQGGTTDTIDTLSSRMMKAVWRNDSLWTTHTVDVAGEATVRWYEISTTGGVYALVQTGDVDPGPGTHTYMPAIAVDEAGNMGITYTQSSASDYPAMMFAGRAAPDAPGYIGAGILVMASNSYYDPSYATTERWGDYGGLWVDAADGATFWAFHE